MGGQGVGIDLVMASHNPGDLVQSDTVGLVAIPDDDQSDWTRDDASVAIPDDDQSDRMRDVASVAIPDDDQSDRMRDVASVAIPDDDQSDRTCTPNCSQADRQHIDMERGHHSPVPAIAALSESPADFRSPKRRRLLSPGKWCPLAANTDKDVEDSQCCPICFEGWTTSGNHRLSALKCGHLFGQSCIEKWLSGPAGKCPQCNAKAKRQHIRVLYAKSIKAVDTTERDRAVLDLQKERGLRRQADMAAAQLRLQLQVAVEDRRKLGLELQTLHSQLTAARTDSGSSSHPGTSNTQKVAATPSTSGSSSHRGTSNTQKVAAAPSTNCTRPASPQFVPDRAIKIWNAGGCRVLAYSGSMATLVVSQPSASSLFPGFGVKKISTLDLKSSEYLTIHSKAVRDLAFHPSVDNGILLSCGLDKKVKMTSLLTNAVVQAYDTVMAAWSCVWNADDNNYFYAGLQNGLVLEYDIRHTAAAVQELNTASSRSPVVALCYMPKNIQADFRAGGLLIGQLDGVSFFESVVNEMHRPHLLPLEGILTSLHMEASTRHILASFRPTARHPNIRHELCELVQQDMSHDPAQVDTMCSCRPIATFRGGQRQTVLSRAVLVPLPEEHSRLLICAGDEDHCNVNIWDSGSCELKQRLSATGFVLDMCTINVNNSVYLTTLTEKQLKVFKWS